MKASLTTLVAILTIGSFGLPADSVAACGGYGGGFGYSRSSYGYGGGFGSSRYGSSRYSRGYSGGYNDSYGAGYGSDQASGKHIYDQCYHPEYSTCVVLPGETCSSLSERVYGNDGMWKHIATYNGLAVGAPLPVGQPLQFPVINANGTLAASNAGPAPASFGLQEQPQFPQITSPVADPAAAQNAVPNTVPMQQPAVEAAQPATPAANIRTATAEESFPNVAMGSILMLDGQELGDKAGIVRMRVGGLALPVKVLDWNDDTAKIQLPQLDLAKTIQAQIEVMRADGSLASKSTINLTPAATRLALGN